MRRDIKVSLALDDVLAEGTLEEVEERDFSSLPITSDMAKSAISSFSAALADLVKVEREVLSSDLPRTLRPKKVLGVCALNGAGHEINHAMAKASRLSLVRSCENILAYSSLLVVAKGDRRRFL